jgi:serine/threonine protein kinase
MTEIGTRGEIFGSPHYIAPEQAISSAGAGPKSDLYSIGIILYEMFTGKWPFDAENPMDIAMMHMTDDPRPPRTLRPNIRPALEAVILKAIAKEPENRYANGVELANAFEKALKARQQESWEETTAVRQSISERIILEMNENPLPPLPAAIPQANATIYQPVVPLSQPLSSRTVAHPRPLNSVVLAAVAGCVLLGAVVLALFAMLLWPDNSEQKKESGSNENTAIPNSIAGVGTEIVNQATVALSPTPSSMPTWVVSPITNSIPTAAIVPTLISSPVQAPQPTYPATVASPSPLIEVATSYTLLLASHKDDSLFIMNAGKYSFPLALLHLGDGAGALDGSEWALPVLAPGECVAVWKDDGKPKAPEIDCDLVGNEVKRQGSERFWQTDFNIYFNGVLVAQDSGKLFLFTIVG